MYETTGRTNVPTCDDGAKVEMRKMACNVQVLALKLRFCTVVLQRDMPILAYIEAIAARESLWIEEFSARSFVPARLLSGYDVLHVLSRSVTMMRYWVSRPLLCERGGGSNFKEEGR